jgi:hypothetical protein
LRLSIDKHTIIRKLLNHKHMAEYLIYHYCWNIHGSWLYFACHNTFKIWSNQHNVYGRFFTISILINDTPLYLANIQLILKFTKLTQKKVRGKSLWENYIQPNSIIVTYQMRQNKNIQYATLLENLWTKIF